MGLRSSETSGGGQYPAETDADERTAYDRTTARPTFTPVQRDAAHDMGPESDTMPDDVAAQAPTMAEPAGSYRDADGVDEPARSSAPAGAGQPAGTYEDAEMDQAPAGEETLGAREMPAPARGRTMTAAPGAAASGSAPASAAGGDLDQPLLSGNAELLAHWQRVQAGFVDDPQAAVAGAADLVEQAGQALADALRQRQRQMRSMWDRDPADGSAAPGDAKADTEQLRQMMRRYRNLFDRLYQPT